MAGMSRWCCALTTTLAASLLVSACTVGPEYVRPTVVTPRDYKEAAGWKVAEPGEGVMRGRLVGSIQ